jgi:NTE family protein
VADAIDGGLSRLRRGRRGAAARRAEAEEAGAPNLFEILTASMTILEHELARHRLASEAVDVVLAPDVLGIRSLEFHKGRQAIAAGVSAAEAALPEIVELLKRRRRLRRYWSRGSNS